jgi:class I fructose-bisphosphate aldolase
MNARLNRLFAADGRCFDVAIDHGFFGEASFLAGIKDMLSSTSPVDDAEEVRYVPGQIRSR